MESVALILLIIAFILFIIAAIWYLVTLPTVMPAGLSALIAIAFFLLILAVIIGIYSVSLRGVALNERGLPGLTGIHTPV